MSAVTLAQVARAAQVGYGTASRAMAGHRQVAARTRQKVLAAAKQLGYIPDNVSRRLVARRWQTGATPRLERGAMALLSCEPLASHHITPAAEAATACGYRLECHEVRDEARIHRVLRELHARGCEGILIRSSQGRFPAIASHRFASFRVLLVSRHPRYVDFDSIGCDATTAIFLAYAKLTELGARRIGFWVEDERGEAHPRRAIGALLALRHAHSAGGAKVFFKTNGDFSLLDGELLEWIEKSHLDALVVPYSGHARILQPTLPRPLSLVALSGRAPAICGDVGFDFGDLVAAAAHRLAEFLISERVATRPTATLLEPAWNPPPSEPGQNKA